MSVLRIDSSANLENSVTRDLTDQVVASLGETSVVTRDLAKNPLPSVTQEWSEARLVPVNDRSATQRATLALSDELIQELKSADTIIIGTPVYNFGVPASLKAWIDLVARPGETFKYTDVGPEGLLTGKRAIIVYASGGVPKGSDWDYASGYLRHFLGFIGITDVTIVAADAMAKDPDATIARAKGEIEALAKAA